MRAIQTTIQPRTRLLAAAVALTAVGIGSACSYDDLKTSVAITVTVHGIPGTADHLEVDLTDAAGNIRTVKPAFGPGSFADLIVSLPAPATTGVVTIDVRALDHDQGKLAIGTFTGNYQTPGLAIEATLTLLGAVGSFGSACGSNGYCSPGLSCKKLPADTVGVCTKDCPSGISACDSLPAGATCQPFNAVAGTNVCQWECDLADGGKSACPTGLSCGPQVSGGKRFCQGGP